MFLLIFQVERELDKMVFENVLCKRETSTKIKFDKNWSIYFVHDHGYANFWGPFAESFPSSTQRGSKIRELFVKAYKS